MVRFMKKIIFYFLLLLGVAFQSVTSNASEQPVDLRNLLNQVQNSAAKERQLDKKREQAFKSSLADQKRILNAAENKLARERARTEELKNLFNANEESIANLRKNLDLQMGNLGELFGIVRQVADDVHGVMDDSMVSAEIPNRGAFLETVSSSKSLPDIEALNQLWFELQREMTENGRVSQFNTVVTSDTGEQKNVQVTRIGAFTAVADNKFLAWNAETQQLNVLVKQPESNHLKSFEAFDPKANGIQTVSIDPTRGVLLNLLTLKPDLWARIQQGKFVGYIIIAIAIIGVLAALIRIQILSLISSRVKKQLKDMSRANDNNPLGRVIGAVEDEKGKLANIETFELKMDEAILKEVPSLERGQSIIKLLAAVAPLLGLLGTVTGMIGTFQTITLFGTSDPKLMAAGISQALITTALGLVAAIPLLLAHNVLVSRSKNIVNVLEQQAAGFIAMRAEKMGVHDNRSES